MTEERESPPEDFATLLAREEGRTALEVGRS